MAQSVVTVRLNGQPYQMGCGPGEEAHIEALAKEVDTIITSLKAEAGQLGDARLLAMAALILADQKHSAQNGATSGQPVSASNGASQTSLDIDGEGEAMLADQLKAMTDKLCALKKQLETAS